MAARIAVLSNAGRTLTAALGGTVPLHPSVMPEPPASSVLWGYRGLLGAYLRQHKQHVSQTKLRGAYRQFAVDRADGPPQDDRWDKCLKLEDEHAHVFDGLRVTVPGGQDTVIRIGDTAEVLGTDAATGDIVVPMRSNPGRWQVARVVLFFYYPLAPVPGVAASPPALPGRSSLPKADDRDMSQCFVVFQYYKMDSLKVPGLSLFAQRSVEGQPYVMEPVAALDRKVPVYPLYKVPVGSKVGNCSAGVALASTATLMSPFLGF